MTKGLTKSQTIVILDAEIAKLRGELRKVNAELTELRQPISPMIKISEAYYAVADDIKKQTKLAQSIIATCEQCGRLAAEAAMREKDKQP